MALSHLVSQHHAHKMWVFDYVLFWRLTDSCKSGVDETGLLRGFRTVVSVDFLCCEDVLLVSVVDVVGPLVAKR